MIARYDVTLGKEVVLVGAELGQLASAREIALYRPFYGKRSTVGEKLERLLRKPDQPALWWLGWAKEHKDQHRDLMRDMQGVLKRFESDGRKRRLVVLEIGVK